MGVITVSKEAVTDSEKIASLLARRLGWQYVGKQLVARIAKELNISQNDVEVFRRASQSGLMRFIDRYTCSVIQKVVDREYGCLDDRNYFETTKKLVEALYGAGNAIIVGWGGQCILRQRPFVLHVRLVKDPELKLQELMKTHGMESQSAREFIEREESDSRDYIKHYFKEDWSDPALYDTVIDMGKVSPENAVALIAKKWEEKEAGNGT
jgi:cytidylate kinase